MKNTIDTLRMVMGILILALVILTVVPLSLQAGRAPMPSSEGHGQWVYDINGNHKGCVSPGSDCTWSS